MALPIQRRKRMDTGGLTHPARTDARWWKSAGCLRDAGRPSNLLSMIRKSARNWRRSRKPMSLSSSGSAPRRPFRGPGALASHQSSRASAYRTAGATNHSGDSGRRAPGSGAISGICAAFRCRMQDKAANVTSSCTKLHDLCCYPYATSSEV